MAFKGTAGKSASGASMSKYDVEVEARLQALEKGLAECKKTCDSHSHTSSGGGDIEQLKADLNQLEVNFNAIVQNLRKQSLLT